MDFGDAFGAAGVGGCQSLPKKSSADTHQARSTVSEMSNVREQPQLA
jgi:hypothetical protein